MNLNREEKDLILHMGLLSNLLVNAEFYPKGTFKQKASHNLLLEVLDLNQKLADNYLDAYDKDDNKILFDDYCGGFDFETPFIAQDFLNNLLYLCENASKRMQTALNTKVIKKWLKDCGAHISAIYPASANKVIKEFRRINTFEYE